MHWNAALKLASMLCEMVQICPKSALHVMKILERVVEGRVKKIVKIDDMQFGFMAGKGPTDAIFIVRQLQ